MRIPVLVGAIGLLSCGSQPKAAGSVSIPFTLTQSQCRSLANNPPIEAKLIIQGIEAPCPLTVTKTGQDEFLTQGTCQNIPVGEKRILTLRWFVRSPNVAKEIVIAESIGAADLTTAMQSTVQIAFDDEDSPALRPKTKAAPTETAAEKDRFNCDRSGQFGPGDSPCDSTKPVTQTPGADRDNCSNLEELCKDTLFKATDDTDCN